MPETIRVLLAEDSATIRQYLTTLIEEIPGMRVVGQAANGRDVIDMALRLKPNVISMDVRMPVLDGLEATRRIMAQQPTPVVVVSGLLDEDINLSLQALEAGALAVVSKPPDRTHPAFEHKRRQLLTTLRAMAGVRVISRRDRLHRVINLEADPSQSYRIADHENEPQWQKQVTRRIKPEIIAIGASTGGPSALHRLLRSLPDDLPLPMVIVQHIPNEFIDGLTRWLASVTHLRVQVATHGQILRPGMVVISPGTAHLLIERRGMDLITRLDYDSNGYRYHPSVDALFHSIARTCGSAAIGIVLTGMGDDGTLGLQAMHDAGAHTLAQDAASSTVFGMPNAAIQRGVINQIVSLADLSSEILKLL